MRLSSLRRVCFALFHVLLMLLAIAPVAEAEGTAAVIVQTGHNNVVHAIDFSADGRLVATAGFDETIKIWDIPTGRELRTLGARNGPVWSIVFTRGGHHLLSGHDDGNIRVWEVGTGRQIATLSGHQKAVRTIAATPDGSRLASASDDGTSRLWDLQRARELQNFPSLVGSKSVVDISVDGSLFAWVNPDGAISAWEIKTEKIVAHYEATGLVLGLTALKFSPDAQHIAIAEEHSSTLRILGLKSQTALRSYEIKDSSVTALAYSTDGRFMVVGGSNGKIIELDAPTGRELRVLNAAPTHTSLPAPPVSAIAMSRDAQYIAAAVEFDTTIRFWGRASNKAIRILGGGEQVRAMALSEDGRKVFSGGLSNLATLWDAATGLKILTFHGHENWILATALSRDGRLAATGGYDNRVMLWDLATGQNIRRFDVQNRVDGVAISRDGRMIAAAGEAGLTIWDAASGRNLALAKEENRPLTSIAFSADDRHLIAVERSGSVVIFDSSKRRFLKKLEGHSGSITALAVSDRNNVVLSGSNDGSVRLSNALTGAPLLEVREHKDQITAVGLSSDGRYGISGSYGSLLLWDAVTGRVVHVLDGHRGYVMSAIFTPDGRRIISAGEDGAVRIWSTETGRQLGMRVSFASGGSMTIVPSGFFNFSGGGELPLHIVRGLNITTIDQVHQSLYNPDLVREALADDPRGEVAAASRVINLDKVLDAGPAPTVTLSPPPATSASDLVTLTAKANGRGKGIGRVEWRVNGVTAAVVVPNRQGAADELTLKQSLALDPGDNTIEVVAYTASNLLASLPARATLKYVGPHDTARPRLHVLAIGIDGYTDKGWTPPGATAPLAFGPLSLAVKDATAFSKAIQVGGTGQYAEVRITTALDREATVANLETVIDRLAKEVHPRDTFVLFAAAHGVSQNGRFYMIPFEYQGGTDPAALARRAIGQERIQDWVANRIKAKRAVIFLDTCESGALVGGASRSRLDAPSSEAALGRLHEATGRPVLTAAAEGQFAHEGIIGDSGVRHGIFTWAILEALKKGDRNGNGRIELSELVAYVQSEVPALAARLGGAGRAAAATPVFGEQSARFGSRGEDFSLVAKLL